MSVKLSNSVKISPLKMFLLCLTLAMLAQNWELFPIVDKRETPPRIVLVINSSLIKSCVILYLSVFFTFTSFLSAAMLFLKNSTAFSFNFRINSKMGCFADSVKASFLSNRAHRLSLKSCFFFLNHYELITDLLLGLQLNLVSLKNLFVSDF